MPRCPQRPALLVVLINKKPPIKSGGVCSSIVDISLSQCPLITHSGHSNRVPALLTINRKSVDRAVLSVVGRLGDAIVFGWRFGPCCARRGLDLLQSFRLRLWLSGKYCLRCHAGRWRSGESLYRVGMPSLWQTDAPAGDYHRRTALQRCSATNSSAINTKPTTAKKARTGIACSNFLAAPGGHQKTP